MRLFLLLAALFSICLSASAALAQDPYYNRYSEPYYPGRNPDSTNRVYNEPVYRNRNSWEDSNRARYDEARTRSYGRDSAFEREIQEGRRSGDLTAKEAEKLRRQHYNHNVKESRMRADGDLSWREELSVRKMRDKERVDRWRYENNRRRDW